MKDKTDVLADALVALYREYLNVFADTDIEMTTFRRYLRTEICDLYGVEEDEWVCDEGDEIDGD